MAEHTDKPETEETSSIPDVLKQGFEETRLPAGWKAHVLAELPPAEEMERLFRELQEHGGLSSEQFFASLGLADQPKP